MNRRRGQVFPQGPGQPFLQTRARLKIGALLSIWQVLVQLLSCQTVYLSTKMALLCKVWGWPRVRERFRRKTWPCIDGSGSCELGSRIPIADQAILRKSAPSLRFGVWRISGRSSGLAIGLQNWQTHPSVKHMERAQRNSQFKRETANIKHFFGVMTSPSQIPDASRPTKIEKSDSLDRLPEETPGSFSAWWTKRETKRTSTV